MRRREFITLLGGAVAAWQVSASAQQKERMRRIGILMSISAEDSEGKARVDAFLQSLEQLGWIEGRSAQIDIRWGAGDTDSLRRHAAELVTLAPDVILASGGSVMGPLLQETRSVPIVFTSVIDPVAGGYVENLARPGGNATGFTVFEHSIGGKWLELLRQIAPLVKRVAVLRDTLLAAGFGQLGAIQGVAPSFGVELTPVDVRDPPAIERAVEAFARSANGGLIVTGSGPTNVHRKFIIALAARLRLPAVYPNRFFVTDGGLMSYGADSIDPHRRAAGYVDRILKGEKPAELPVQAPNRYELTINLKTAKALGIDVPESLLARADEVIE